MATLGILGYLARPQTPALRVTRIVNLSHSAHAWHRESLLYDKFLAVSRGEADAERFSRLWLVPVVGGPPRRLGSLQTNDFAWSPDGGSLAFARHTQIFLAAADGTGAHPLAAVPGHAFYLRWSPDGTRLRFTVRDERGQLSIWEVSARGENLHQLKFKWSGALAEGFGDWTPDGRYYLFVSRREGVSNLWALEEKSDWRHRRRSEPMQLTAGPISYTRLLAGRDDTQLFALGMQRGGELLRYDMAKKEFVPFLGGRSAEHLNFTRDGRWVTYVAYPEGTLWRARSDGSQQLQLTFPPLLARNPQWSPDGKRILFEAARSGELGKIYTISVDGGAPELLVSEPYAQSNPSWWPSGDSIIYSLHKMGGNEDVCRIDLHNGHTERVPFTDGLSRPLLSPDGRNLAAQPADTMRQYVVVDLKTGKRTLLTKRNLDDLTWSPDSKYIYFYTHDTLLPDKPALFRIHISDNKEEKITDVAMSTTGINGSRIGLAPDGSPLLLRDRDQTDVYGLSLAMN